MRCMVCFNEVPKGEEVCPLCGFTQYDVIGDTKEAQAILNTMADKHRNVFLKKYDLGINIFTWKDDNGTIALKEKKRISIGTCDRLQNNTVWVEGKFARIPELKEQPVELSVIKDEKEKTITVNIPALKESELLSLGVEMQKDLTVCLILKNDSSQAKSQPVSIF